MLILATEVYLISKKEVGIDNLVDKRFIPTYLLDITKKRQLLVIFLLNVLALQVQIPKRNAFNNKLIVAIRIAYNKNRIIEKIIKAKTKSI